MFDSLEESMFRLSLALLALLMTAPASAEVMWSDLNGVHYDVIAREFPVGELTFTIEEWIHTSSGGLDEQRQFIVTPNGQRFQGAPFGGLDGYPRALECDLHTNDCRFEAFVQIGNLTYLVTKQQVYLYSRRIDDFTLLMDYQGQYVIDRICACSDVFPVYANSEPAAFEGLLMFTPLGWTTALAPPAIRSKKIKNLDHQGLNVYVEFVDGSGAKYDSLYDDWWGLSFTESHPYYRSLQDLIQVEDTAEIWTVGTGELDAAFNSDYLLEGVNPELVQNREVLIVVEINFRALSTVGTLSVEDVDWLYRLDYDSNGLGDGVDTAAIAHGKDLIIKDVSKTDLIRLFVTHPRKRPGKKERYVLVIKAIKTCTFQSESETWTCTLDPTP